VSTGADHGHC